MAQVCSAHPSIPASLSLVVYTWSNWKETKTELPMCQECAIKCKVPSPCVECGTKTRCCYQSTDTSPSFYCEACIHDGFPQVAAMLCDAQRSK